MGFVRIFAAFLILLAVPACQDQRATTQNNSDGQIGGKKFISAEKPSVDELVAFFDAVVFHSEIGPAYAQSVIAKWRDGPVRVAFRNLHPEQKWLVPVASKQMLSITAITFVPLLWTPNPEEADIDIVFARKAEMGLLKIPTVDPELIQELAVGSGTYHLAWKKPEDTIVKAVVVVDIERPLDAIGSGILEELTQCMGLPNDTDMVRPSLFSDRDQLDSYTFADMMIIRALYDKRMERGLPRQQALVVARRIFSELLSSRGSEPLVEERI